MNALSEQATGHVRRRANAPSIERRKYLEGGYLTACISKRSRWCARAGTGRGVALRVRRGAAGLRIAAEEADDEGERERDEREPDEQRVPRRHAGHGEQRAGQEEKDLGVEQRVGAAQLAAGSEKAHGYYFFLRLSRIT